MVVILNFCFKKFGFGLHADSVVLVDFLHVLSSVEMRFISAPNPLEQKLGLLPQLQLRQPTLGCTSPGYVWYEVVCVFNKGGQGGVILFIESISILRRVVD